MTMTARLGPVTRILWECITNDTTPTAELSRRTGIPRYSIDRFRKGRGNIRGTTADKLAAYYGLQLPTDGHQ